MHIVSDDIERIEEGLVQSLAGEDNKHTKVKYSLTGTTAKLEIRLDGAPDETSQKIQQIYRAITTFFNSGAPE
jgi:hypothetical protein